MEKGWYPDPQNDQQYRWWNGESWTDDVRSGDEEREELQEEGEEIELEQGAREAIEKRRQALHRAGAKFSHAEPRRRRRQQGKPTSKPEEAAKPAPAWVTPEGFPDIEETIDIQSSAGSEFEGFEEITPVLESVEEPPPADKTTEETQQAKKQKSPSSKKKTKKKSPKNNESNPKRKKKPAFALFAVIKTSLGQKAKQVKKSSKEKSESRSTLPLKKILLFSFPVVLMITVIGILVLLPGDDSENNKTLQVGRESSEAKEAPEKEVDPEQLALASVQKCLRSDPAVRSAVFEKTAEGESSWKVIFVDQNYQLITVTEKSSIAEAKSESNLSATSFVSAAGGKYTILGPLKGIEGSGIKTSSKLLQYISSLQGCLGKV